MHRELAQNVEVSDSCGSSKLIKSGFLKGRVYYAPCLRAMSLNKFLLRVGLLLRLLNDRIWNEIKKILWKNSVLIYFQKIKKIEGAIDKVNNNINEDKKKFFRKQFKSQQITSNWLFWAELVADRCWEIWGRKPDLIEPPSLLWRLVE